MITIARLRRAQTPNASDSITKRAVRVNTGNGKAASCVAVPRRATTDVTYEWTCGKVVRPGVRYRLATSCDDFLGGTGLGVYLMLREQQAAVDPLSPEACLAFVFSPLVGSPLTTSAKFAVVSKSPLTNRYNDSLVSSGFAIAGKRTGADALVITGRAAEPSVSGDRRRSRDVGRGRADCGARRRRRRRPHSSRDWALTFRSRSLGLRASVWFATRPSRTMDVMPAGVGWGP